VMDCKITATRNVVLFKQQINSFKREPAFFARFPTRISKCNMEQAQHRNLLMLAREFNHGEPVSDYCKALAMFLTSKKGWTVDLVVFGSLTHSSDETLSENFHVHRVPFPIHTDSYFNWMMLVNNEFKLKGRELYTKKRAFDIIHANDWSTAPAAISLSKYLELPVTMTLHSTENQRGFGTPHSSIISTMEWFACFEIPKIIVSSNDTLNSLKYDLGVPEGKMLLARTYEAGWERIIADYFESVVSASANAKKKEEDAARK